MQIIIMSEDSFYRCYKALHYITHEAIPCVEDSLKTWHSNQQQSLSPCIVQCPGGKKPKLPASCFNCVDWANAIETVYYQAGANPSTQKTQKPIRWQNVHSSDFHKSHVEVAKAFVLRLPKIKPSTSSTTNTTTKQASSSSQTTAGALASTSSVSPGAVSSSSSSSPSSAQVIAASGSTSVKPAAAVSAGSNPSSSSTPPSVSQPAVALQYTKISHFDSGSVLMIMARFSDFHGRDQTAYELIDKVCYCHYSVNKWFELYILLNPQILSLLFPTCIVTVKT